MQYESTRGLQKGILSADAIKMGIASDGGLFVPQMIKRFTLDEIHAFTKMSYNQRALEILKIFLSDYSEDELRECISIAYREDKFSAKDIAPLVTINENVSLLELWHGSTCAFKDMALQILPHLLIKSLKKSEDNSQIVILVATSGDTGKAAMEGFRDVEGTKVIVFYPNQGVSEIQKLQMTTQEGSNVFAVGVCGNFDDAQTGVKAIFADSEFTRLLNHSGIKLSSANSINWGRLAPQIVYYFSAYAEMINKGEITCGNAINFVIPTGNFGNILAAYYAMKMGLPINKLICASNENNVLTDFINKGIYDINRDFKKTISPSMDILISSNLERLLFDISNQDSNKIMYWMNDLRLYGQYSVDDNLSRKIKSIFWAGYSTESDTLKTIECIYNDYNYVVDTHTAVAFDVYDKYVISTGDITKTVIVSTASPFKFNDSVSKAIMGESSVEGKTEFQLLDTLSQKCGLKIPTPLCGLDKKTIIHSSVCDKNEMKEMVRKILGV